MPKRLQTKTSGIYLRLHHIAGISLHLNFLLEKKRYITLDNTAESKTFMNAPNQACGYTISFAYIYFKMLAIFLSCLSIKLKVSKISTFGPCQVLLAYRKMAPSKFSSFNTFLALLSSISCQVSMFLTAKFCFLYSRKSSILKNISKIS